MTVQTKSKMYTWALMYQISSGESSEVQGICNAVALGTDEVKTAYKYLIK